MVGLTISCVSSHAFISDCTSLAVDLAKEGDAKKIDWSKDNWALSERGLRLVSAGKNLSRTAWVESQPIPVGWSWRAATSVGITSEIHLHSSDHKPDSVRNPFLTALFVRYSPDRKHWSNWQVLTWKQVKEKQQYVGRISIPYRQQTRYRQYLKQFSKMEVPWPKDQEAAVKWMARQEPDFLKKEMPFIGYVQFHFQLSANRSGRYVSKMWFALTFGRSGGEYPDGHEERDEIRWRYRADGKSNEE